MKKSSDATSESNPPPSPLPKQPMSFASEMLTPSEIESANAARAVRGIRKATSGAAAGISGADEGGISQSGKFSECFRSKCNFL